MLGSILRPAPMSYSVSGTNVQPRVDDMSTENGTSPNVIRAACRGRFYSSLETLSAIAADPETKDADRIRAIDTLGRFGLGAADQAAVHIHGDVGALAAGVVHLPALEPIQEVSADVAGAGAQEGPEGPKLLTSG